MDLLALVLHVLNFLAPAFAVAVGVTLAARVLLPRHTRPQRWWWPLAFNFAAGSAALAAGLVLFGRDGKMLSYAALAAAVATSQWLAGRAWRSGAG